MVVEFVFEGKGSIDVESLGHAHCLHKVVVLVTRLGPEEVCVSDFVHHCL